MVSTGPSASKKRSAPLLDDVDQGHDKARVAIRIGDTTRILEYYRLALIHFSQLNCRILAKHFIKFVEPYKRSQHPYNGKPRQGSAPDATIDPEMTKPNWWPKDVIHKEPDHLLKESRIKLLLHIMLKLGEYGITASRLIEAAHATVSDLTYKCDIEIIYEILEVRKIEEQFERGEVDGEKIVDVPQRECSRKRRKRCRNIDDMKSKERASITSGEYDHATPASSVQQTAPSTSPIDNPSNGSYTFSGNVSIPDLSLGVRRLDRPYPLGTIPSIPTMTNIASLFSNDLFIPFPNSGPDQAISSVLGCSNHWEASTFSQNSFGLGLSTTGPTELQSSISYQNLTSLPSYAHISGQIF